MDARDDNNVRTAETGTKTTTSTTVGNAAAANMASTSFSADGNISLDTSSEMNATAGSWEISKMADQIERELESDGDGDGDDVVKGQLARDGGERRPNGSAAATVRLEEEEETMDQLTSNALSREVNEMCRKDREEEDEEDDDSEEDEEEDEATDVEEMINDIVNDKEMHATPEETDDKTSKMSEEDEDDGVDDCQKEGHLVWAKVRGYSYWPAVVTVDPIDGQTCKESDSMHGQYHKRVVRCHVHFLAYENQRAWVPRTAMITFRGARNFHDMAKRAVGQKKKDFNPGKKYQALFDRAIQVAEDASALPRSERLKNLGYEYVLVESSQSEVKVKTAAQRKFAPPLPSQSQSQTPKKRKKSQDSGAESPQSTKKRKKSSEDSNLESEATQAKKPKQTTADSPVPKKRGPKKKSTTPLSKNNGTVEESPNKPLASGKRRISTEAKNTNPSAIVKTEKAEEEEEKDKHGWKKKVKERAEQEEKALSSSPWKDPYAFSSDDEEKAALSKKIGKPKEPNKKNLFNKTYLSPSKKRLAQLSSSVFSEDDDICGLTAAESTPPPKQEQKEKPQKKKQKTGGPKQLTPLKINSPRASSSSSSPAQSVHVSSPSAKHEIRDIHGDQNTDDDFALDPTCPDAPGLGSLVWGRMAGYPYWPCFVTRSPDGDFRRDYGKRRDVHVQFFNWNDESGWASKTLPWCSMDEFEEQGRRVPKYKDLEAKSFRIQGKGMLQKWKEAYEEANGTKDMTRRERHDKYVVFYRGSNDPVPLPSFLTMPARVKKRRQRRQKADSEEPSAAASTSASSVSPTTTSNNTKKATSNSKPGRKPASASTPSPSPVSTPKKYKSKQPAQKQKQRASKTSQTKEKPPSPTPSPSPTPPPSPSPSPQLTPSSSPTPQTQLLSNGDLPPGWTVRTLDHERDPPTQEFQSPDGGVFESLADVIKHLFQQNIGPQHTRRRSYSACGGTMHRSAAAKHKDPDAKPGWFIDVADNLRYETEAEHTTQAAGLLDGRVRYVHDRSLPRTWTVKKIRRHRQHCDTHVETLYISPEDEVFSSKLEVANYLETKGHPAIELEQLITMAATGGFGGGSRPDSAVPVLSVNVVTCQAEELQQHPILAKAIVPCFVDMVKLPDIFLEHPSVVVKELANEVVITDVVTKEFIAKKIVYDQ